MSNPPARQAKWDPWNMFDITDKERELIKKRQVMLKENKAKFRELVDNPKLTGRGGWVLDPAVQRWYTARATQRSHFAPDLRSGLFFLCIVVIPMVGLASFGIRKKKRDEALWGQGKVKILDRWTRFHY